MLSLCVFVSTQARLLAHKSNGTTFFRISKLEILIGVYSYAQKVTVLLITGILAMLVVTVHIDIGQDQAASLSLSLSIIDIDISSEIGEEWADVLVFTSLTFIISITISLSVMVHMGKHRQAALRMLLYWPVRDLTNRSL